jgi:hypothetical protein
MTKIMTDKTCVENNQESPPLDRMIKERTKLLSRYISALEKFYETHYDSTESLTDAQRIFLFQSAVDAEEIYCTIAMAANNLYDDFCFRMSFVDIGKWIVLRIEVDSWRKVAQGFPLEKEIRPSFERYQLIPRDRIQWVSLADTYWFKSTQSELWDQLFPSEDSNG